MLKSGNESRNCGENFRLSTKSDLYRRLVATRAYHYFLLRLEDSSIGPEISDVLRNRPDALLDVALREQQKELHYDELLRNAPWRRCGDGFIAMQLEREIRWRICCARQSDE